MNFILFEKSFESVNDPLFENILDEVNFLLDEKSQELVKSNDFVNFPVFSKLGEKGKERLNSIDIEKIPLFENNSVGEKNADGGNEML